MIVDEIHGKIRLRSWPKPRPGQRNPTNEYWTRWLKAATYVYRYSPAKLQWALQEATKGTVWMPRDVLISAMRGRAFLLQDELGRTYYPMAFVTDVSNSLDAIGQTPGDMLWRGPDMWQRILPGNLGDNLINQGPATPPIWTPYPTNLYTPIPLILSSQGSQTINVNSTSYISAVATRFHIDFSVFKATAYRISISGGSNQAGQSITMQLTPSGFPDDPLSAAGDDFEVTTSPVTVNSPWIEIPNRTDDIARLQLAMKGSNSTVDFVTTQTTLHFRT